MSLIQFKDLPASYRWSQSTMLASVATLFFARHLPFQLFPNGVQIAIWVTVSGIASLAVLTACYVVIRYPYISLVPTSDQDVFSKQFVSPRLLYVAKFVFVLGILGFAVLMAGKLFDSNGFQIKQAALLLYFCVLFLFTLFLCFWYQPLRHPTVATFIRATLGIGLVLAPVILPILMIGSIRCRRLLDAEERLKRSSGSEREMFN